MINKCFLIGRIVRDPDIRSTAGAQPMTIARYTLAVDRRAKQGEEKSADFLPCVAFGKNGEFAEKYLRKGMKIAVTGHLQTGSYKNKDGVTVYTTDVIVEEQEFAESKNAQASAPSQSSPADAWQNVPDNISEDELPFGG